MWRKMRLWSRVARLGFAATLQQDSFDGACLAGGWGRAIASAFEWLRVEQSQ
jgi:hypothetical protein